MKQLLSTIKILFLGSLFLIPACQKEMNSKITKTQVDNISKSTIIYTDLKPDSLTITTRPFSLDLNNDRTFDFTISTSAGVGRCGAECSGRLISARIVAVSGSENTVASRDATYAFLMDSSSVISASSHWSTNTNSSQILHMTKICPCPGSFGNLGGPDKYLGLKIKKAGNTYYGWVRISGLTGFGGIYIRDYAYNTISNQPILAGQKK